MTSSLVGSEMCIRDSGKRPRSETDSENPRPYSSDRREEDEDPGREEGDEAVSYTHLTLPTICSV
eukprot:289140-Prorocentrum_lima.AAC.1